MAQNGEFRADLLDRLAFDVLTIPPLRHRTDDILVLAEHFAVAMAKEMGRTMFAGFSHRAKAILQSYDWPGNVRELKNTVERAVYRIAEEDEVDDIILDPFESPYRLKNQSLDTIPTANQTPDEFPVDLKEQTKAREIALIEAALKAAKYNQKTAADNLQLTYHQLRGYLKKYNLVGERSAEDGQQTP